jgi:hypothetical protein
MAEEEKYTEEIMWQRKRSKQRRLCCRGREMYRGDYVAEEEKYNIQMRLCGRGREVNRGDYVAEEEKCTEEIMWQRKRSVQRRLYDRGREVYRGDYVAEEEKCKSLNGSQICKPRCCYPPLELEVFIVLYRARTVLLSQSHYSPIVYCQQGVTMGLLLVSYFSGGEGGGGVVEETI